MGRKMNIPDKKFIQETFDSITPHYDLLNQILSFGMAREWRKRASEILLADPGFLPRTILDLGCGTGKFLECFLKKKSWDKAVGVDFSSAMLQKAREAIPGNVLWLQEDFDKLPFSDSSFDLVVSAFTLRSVQNLPEFLMKVYRFLAPGGRAGFLELTRPQNFLHRLFFSPYLRIYLPMVGRLISGNSAAYQFLSQSVANFQSSEKILELMREVGFKNCGSKSFSFGAVTLMIANK